ncbi:hypothetical conserved protein [Candidatus Nitrosoglobus terrae]|uniref:Hypothetical conserved protein n=1 Tax=Candidatus Nitrosoglobus terrae TaxID=1630141 RepID=A0A1Q2SLI4_9GAMM|nr:hypothetical protein [Candidatus Nitrosoglobus terrae]BAW80006.1 hypothetical conserved protein [Candidatus Nitrosoglobus terrae]
MLKFFIFLCLLHSGPAGAPPSSGLLAQTLLAYLSVEWLVSMLHMELAEGLLLTLIDTK